MADDNPLLAEFLEEKASAYFATIRKMQASITALAEFDRSNGSGTAGHSQKNIREELLAAAAEQVWFFVVQREAMKLPYYEEIFSEFEIPEEVCRRLGPRL